MRFANRVHEMNKMYQLPTNTNLTIPHNTAELLTKFKKTLLDEVNEIDEIITAACDTGNLYQQDIDIAVMIADLLGDITVYCRSEALKYGIPLEQVLDVIMDSNESKLGSDGRPIYDENGKFLKGPNFFAPEPKIHELLEGKQVR